MTTRVTDTVRIPAAHVRPGDRVRPPGAASFHEVTGVQPDGPCLSIYLKGYGYRLRYAPGALLEVGMTRPPTVPPTATVIAAPDDGPWATLWGVVDAANEPGRQLVAVLTGGVP